MKRLWFFPMLFWAVPLIAQNRKTIDSLNNIPFETRLAQASKLDVVYLKNASDSKKIKYGLGEGESYSNLSLVYNYKGKYNLSTDYAFRAIQVFERIGNRKKVAFQYGELGYQMKRRNMPKAQYYMLKAKSLAESIPDTTSLLSIYNNYGVLKEMQNQLDSALYFYKKGLVIKRHIKDVTGIPFSLNNIAIIYTMEGNYDQAYALFSEALQMRLSKKDSVGIAENYCYYGDFYSAKKEFRPALDNYRKSLEISKKNKYAHLIQYNYESIALMHQGLGEYKQALENYRQFEKVKDSTVNFDTNARIAELEVQFETGQKEKQLVESHNKLLQEQAESRRKTILFLFICSGVSSLGIIGYLLYRQQKLKNRQILQEHELRSAIANIETQNKLQQQRLSISRDLHDNIGSQLTFIISSVENLKYAFDIAGSKLDTKLSGISEFTRDTIVELRDTIWAMNSGEIKFEDLVSRISNFVEKAREAQSQIDFECVLPHEMENLSMNSAVGMNVYRCIQEAINNAIKYSGATKIRVEIRQSETIGIDISDNGSGFNPEKVALGNGLHNMKKRMADIGGKLRIETSVGKGTRIHIDLDQSLIRKT
ncbi:tetratricopeptide repeat-containing sensor histidine kinase [Flavobacterium silvaticum]|uniref:histidine kinase n=1 Tax=Flavobacterium silvaticum TaxID=1852020 RepID=A0A972JH42_9FLAO|nr:tetratricopeptide repeat protein [Flavobacterium silvaticum]NMH26728.1 tetratricopeptide repeat protein [Flavobacterium silvaticum]